MKELLELRADILKALAQPTRRWDHCRDAFVRASADALPILR